FHSVSESQIESSFHSKANCRNEMSHRILMIPRIISKIPGHSTERGTVRQRHALEDPKSVRREPAASKQQSGSNVLSSSAPSNYLEMWPIMTLPALLNKRLIKESNFW